MRLLTVGVRQCAKRRTAAPSRPRYDVSCSYYIYTLILCIIAVVAARVPVINTGLTWSCGDRARDLGRPVLWRHAAKCDGVLRTGVFYFHGFPPVYAVAVSSEMLSGLGRAGRSAAQREAPETAARRAARAQDNLRGWHASTLSRSNCPEPMYCSAAMGVRAWCSL